MTPHLNHLAKTVPMRGHNMSTVVYKREYSLIIEGEFFLFLIETIRCDPLSEPAHRDGSDGVTTYYI